MYNGFPGKCANSETLPAAGFVQGMLNLCWLHGLPLQGWKAGKQETRLCGQRSWVQGWWGRALPRFLLTCWLQAS